MIEPEKFFRHFMTTPQAQRIAEDLQSDREKQRREAAARRRSTLDELSAHAKQAAAAKAQAEQRHAEAVEALKVAKAEMLKAESEASSTSSRMERYLASSAAEIRELWPDAWTALLAALQAVHSRAVDAFERSRGAADWPKCNAAIELRTVAASGIERVHDLAVSDCTEQAAFDVFGREFKGTPIFEQAEVKAWATQFPKFRTDRK